MSRCRTSRLLYSHCVPSTIRQLYSTRSQRVEAASLLPWRRGAQSQDHVVAVGDGEVAEERPRKDKFIPVTRRSLVRRVREEEGLLNWEEREKLEAFAAALDARFSQRFLGILDGAKVSVRPYGAVCASHRTPPTQHLYDVMDPDKDTVATRQVNRKELLDQERRLLLEVERLLDKANYFMVSLTHHSTPSLSTSLPPSPLPPPSLLLSKVPQHQLKELLHDHDTAGLRVSVDPSMYDTLQIWTRGHSKNNRSRLYQFGSELRRYLLRRPYIPTQNTFTRVFVAVRFKSEKKLHLKVFKDVLCDKLEHLLPDGKIKMSKYDKWFIAGSVGLGSSMLTVRGLPTLASYNLHWTWVGLGLAALAGSRAWVGYRNKRNKYLANLAATLYFKTVANNRGVLTLLADRAVDEEFKEAFLAYVFLLSPRNRRGVPGTAHTALPPSHDTSEELRLRVEQWLQGNFQLQQFQFDIDDALDKLRDLGLLVRHSNNTLSVLGLKVRVHDLLCGRASYMWPVAVPFENGQLQDKGCRQASP